MKPDVSVIIPVHNNLDYTERCLASLAAAKPNVPFEIIIVDNASDDGTKEFLERKAAQGEIRFIRNDPPQPFAASCNRGAEAASGDYLLFLNNDTEAFPGWLDAMMRTITRDDRIGVVGAKLLFPDGTIQHAGVGFHYFRRSRRVGPYHVFRKFPRDAVAVNKEREYRCVTGACLLTRRNLFIESGQFDERFINCFEDVDYCLQVHDSGYKIIYTPEAELIHYEGQTAGRGDNELYSYLLLKEKWGNKFRVDDWSYFEEEGFILVEDELGMLSVLPGKELRQWWEIITQLADIGEFYRALEEIGKLEKILGSYHKDFYLLKGRCYLKTGDFYRARLAYARAAAMDAENPEPKLGLVQIALAQRERTEAARWLQRLLHRYPDDERSATWREMRRQLQTSIPRNTAKMNPQAAEAVTPAASR